MYSDFPLVQPLQGAADAEGGEGREKRRREKERGGEEKGGGATNAKLAQRPIPEVPWRTHDIEWGGEMERTATDQSYRGAEFHELHGRTRVCHAYGTSSILLCPSLAGLIMRASWRRETYRPYAQIWERAVEARVKMVSEGGSAPTPMPHLASALLPFQE